jgi:recombination endonuclease VII
MTFTVEERHARKLEAGKRYRAKRDADPGSREHALLVQKRATTKFVASLKADPALWEEYKEYNRKKSQEYSDRKRLRLAGRPKPDACEVCGSNEQYEHIGICFDHDHATGKFRGWLCAKCNLVLGLVSDSKERLIKLISYLEKCQS